MQVDRKHDEKYNNWVKASLSLYYVKQALAPVAQDGSHTLHNHLKQNVRQKLSTPIVCTNCTHGDIKRTGIKRGIWKTQCPICSVYLDELLKLHANGAHIEWRNTNPTLWSSSPWEVAKVYQPRGCKHQSCAQEADVAALLTFFSECSLMNKLISNLQIIHEVKGIRNSVMHSPNLEVSGTELKTWSDLLIALLEDKQYFASQVSCAFAIKRIKQLDETQNETTKRLDHVDVQLRKNEQVLEQLSLDVESAVKRPDAVTDNIYKIDTLYKRVDLVQKEIEADRTRIESLQQELSDENEKLQCVTGTINSQIQILTDLARTLQYSKVNQIQNTNDNDNTAIKDLRQRLVSIYKEHCCRIPISPMVPEKTEHVDDIYVAPYLESADSLKTRVSPEEGNISELDYSDIFFSKDKHCKNIYITGEAGVGKSAFCESMVNSWCRAHSGTHKELSGDEQVMLTFQLLFYISLRNVVNQSSIEEMIQSQLGCNIGDTLINVKCLVLLDGLDEWKQPHTSKSGLLNKELPLRPVYNNCTFVTTSRSWKFETLRLPRTEVDKHVKIVGLDMPSAEKLARCVIDLHNKNKNQEYAFEEFKHALTKQRIYHFMAVPLVLFQLLCLWFDGKPFGNSQCEIYSNIVEHQLRYAEENRSLEKQTQTETSEKLKLPKCFKNKKLIQKNKSTLYALSQLAFNMMCAEPPGNNNQDNLLQMENIEPCLASGFLTQTTLQNTISERKTRMHFAHKTYQQFFAAVYVVMASSIANQIFRLICTFDNFVELPDLFVFVLGMDSKVGSFMLQYIMKSIANDDRISKNRRSLKDQVTSSVVVQLQNIIMNIFEESDRSGNCNLKLSVEDIKVDTRTIMHLEKHFDKVKFKSVKSLQMRTSNHSLKDKSAFKKIFEQASKSSVLEKICLQDKNNFISSDIIFRSLRETQKTLRSLHIQYVNLSKLSDKISVLFKLKHLESICLKYIYLTHKQIELMATFQFKGATKSIREVHIEGFRCLDHGPLGQCQFSVDLSKLHLKILRLYDIDMTRIQLSKEHLETIEINNLVIPGSIGSIFEQLVRAPVLQTVRVRYCKDEEDIGMLMRALPTCVNLKFVQLSWINMENQYLYHLHQLNGIQFLGLKDISIACEELIRCVDGLLLPFSVLMSENRNDVVVIRLENVSVLKEDHEREFEDYIQSSSQLKVVQLEDGMIIQVIRSAT